MSEIDDLQMELAKERAWHDAMVVNNNILREENAKYRKALEQISDWTINVIGAKCIADQALYDVQ